MSENPKKMEILRIRSRMTRGLHEVLPWASRNGYHLTSPGDLPHYSKSTFVFHMALILKPRSSS